MVLPLAVDSGLVPHLAVEFELEGLDRLRALGIVTIYGDLGNFTWIEAVLLKNDVSDGFLATEAQHAADLVPDLVLQVYDWGLFRRRVYVDLSAASEQGDVFELSREARICREVFLVDRHELGSQGVLNEEFVLGVLEHRRLWEPVG